MADALIVFVKQPRPGAVKTRLARALGDDAAAQVYQVLAEGEVRSTAPVAREYQRFLFFSPGTARAAMEGWFPGETLLPQQGDDLGARMAAAFAEVFARGFARAAIVGSDVPWVTRGHVLEALAAVDRHDLALGPAADGGYYLLALARPLPALFEDVAWSTDRVLAATLERAGRLGLRVRLLEQLPDVDTLDDVASAWERLEPLLLPHPELHARLSAATGRCHARPEHPAAR